ncbi:MAG: hypothetical protein U9Q71_03350 [Pseudomonadota bacterium]|nr:hypothetical protein [Pseudomonadota bacterium]
MLYKQQGESSTSRATGPLDAYRKFFKEQRKQGTFTIRNEAFETP